MKNSAVRGNEQSDRDPESTKPPFKMPANCDFVGHEAKRSWQMIAPSKTRKQPKYSPSSAPHAAPAFLINAQLLRSQVNREFIREFQAYLMHQGEFLFCFGKGGIDDALNRGTVLRQRSRCVFEQPQ